MPDYGHDLRLGAFLTPQARRPRDVVALAQLSEQSGLDVVTFQDHPYQPAFLDTWTLLSYVAAATDRVQLAPDVLNLPLRQPAVAARAAASLDLLGQERLIAGTGAQRRHRPTTRAPPRRVPGADARTAAGTQGRLRPRQRLQPELPDRPGEPGEKGGIAA